MKPNQRLQNMVTKNGLADKLPFVPFHYENGLHGNPNEGFLGDVTRADYGFCVYHGPIAALDKGYPVWVVTTTTFLPDAKLEVWQTSAGPVNISYIMHSVVVVGYDSDSLYINNPYGQKDQKVDRQNFILAWE
ncbi:MAG TPA: C39 family peptidase [Trichococcus sp.]|nr:C39 family peptidase [Trichococcus sp.]